MKSSQNKNSSLWDCEVIVVNDDEEDSEHGKEMFQGPRDDSQHTGAEVQQVHSFTKEDTGITYTAPQYSTAPPRIRVASPRSSMIVKAPSNHHPNPSLPRGQSIYGTTMPDLATPPQVNEENSKGAARNKESTVLEKLLEMEKQILNISVMAEEVEFEIREEKLHARYVGYFDGGEIFPVKSLANLEKMDNILKNDAGFGTRVVLLLRKISGLNSKHYVEKMMAYTVSDNLALMFTLTGRPGTKLAFQKTQLCSLLTRAAKSHPVHQHIDHQIFLAWISEWLQKANFRILKASTCTAVLTID